MSRPVSVAIAASVVMALPVQAQRLERRVLDVARNQDAASVEFSFASRDGVCGDGVRFFSDGLGGDNRIYVDGSSSGWRRGDDMELCVPGPVRVVVSTGAGHIIRLHTYVGPRYGGADGEPTDLGMVSVSDALEFLTELVQQESGRVSSDAILPMVLADSVAPWTKLLRFARDERLPRSVRSSADFWLARGAGAVLGVNRHDESDDDEVRAQAVFALSQQPRESAVPQLIEIVRTSSRPAVRAQALFWLGQSGDPRAIDLFEEILRRR
jgi:HEAT repeat protein